MAQTLKFGKGTWATKTGSSMAYNDQNGNYKPLPFNVERDSIATRVNKQGLIEVVGKDKLRIDYTDSAKGVALLEPSRTNLVTYSEDISNSWWNKYSGASVGTKVTSPSGEQNAYQIIYNGTNGGRIEKNITVTSGASYTFSFYARVSSGTQDFFYGRFGSKSGTITNEWKRFTSTEVETSTTSFPSIQCNDDATIEVFGLQFEQGSYATSYIPTSGSTVTRQADVANGSGNSEVFNDSEGVLFFDGSVLATNENLCISINDGTTSNRVELLWFNDGKFYTQVGNSGQEFISSDTFNNKILIKYGSGSYDLYVNGFRRITDTYTSLAGLNSLDFKRQGSYTFKGKTKELGYYDATLTDSELEYLTSYRSLNELVTELNLNTL